MTHVYEYVYKYISFFSIAKRKELIKSSMSIRYSDGVTINVDRNDLLYFTNETISGTVDVNITKKKLVCYEIYLQFIGGTCLSATNIVQNTNDNSKTETQYRYKRFDFPKVLLAGSEEGQEKFTLYKGKYSWPFQIHLAEHLPPLIHPPQISPRVSYSLRVIIKKSRFHTDVGNFIFVTIYPRIDILNKFYISQTIPFKNTGPKDLTLEGALNKTVYLPGESIEILYSIGNPRQVLIKSIELALIQMTSIETDCHSVRFFTTVLPNTIDFQDKFINERFSITLPFESLPPSFQFPDDSQRRTSIKTSYLIRFEVQIKGKTSIYFYFDVPFLLGTHSKPPSDHRSTFDSKTMPHFSNSDQPPNYESAIRNEN